MIEYKGYIGQIEFDNDANIFHGEIVNTRDVITFQGSSTNELRQSLHDSIETYLKFCAKRGKQPDKPFSGNFIVRLTPDQHRKVFIAAKQTGESLNRWVTRVLEDRADYQISDPNQTRTPNNISRFPPLRTKQIEQKK